MSKTEENIKILKNAFEFPSNREEALDNLATLGTPKAIEAIGERARDPFELPVIRNKALEHLRRKSR